jgi:ankyrin repeat protein
MAENSYGVVVTERMLIEAAQAGDLESLMVCARQGVRVTSGVPLYNAARGGHLGSMRCLVREMGADVNGGIPNGYTPLAIATVHDNMAAVQCLVVELGADVNQARHGGETPVNIAARRGNLAAVRCLVELGAEIGALDDYGNTALLESARNYRYTTMQYLVEEGGASMDDVNNNGETVWDLLLVHLKAVAEGRAETTTLTLTGLLRVLVLRGAPPPALVALLPPEPARVVQEGARLRARLPAYLVRRRALLDAHCPVLLPPLLALVRGYIELTTTEELWATGLGQAP